MSQYYIPDGETRLVCPYDKTHMVPASRFQYHLMDCRNNHKGERFVNCSFNAKHEMPKSKLRHHEANCPDRARLEPYFIHEASEQFRDDSRLKGNTSIPHHSDMEVPATEDWDAEAEGPVRVGVDPSHYSRVRFMNIGGMSTGEKKQMRKDGNLPNEEKIKNMLENIQIDRQENPQDEEGALRLPKTTSFAAMANRPELRPREQPMSSVFAYTVGRGRARGRGLRPSNAGPVNGEQVKVNPDTEPINTENGTTNSPSETPTQIYERVLQRGPGRGRGLAVGLGGGRAPMGMGFVPPPPGFLGAGKAGPLGVAAHVVYMTKQKHEELPGKQRVQMSRDI